VKTSQFCDQYCWYIIYINVICPRRFIYFSNFYCFLHMTAELSKVLCEILVGHCMACKISTLNANGFLPFGVHWGPDVPHTSIVYSVQRITLQMCGNAFRASEYRIDVVRATKGTQVEVRGNGERWGKKIMSGGFMCWKNYSLVLYSILIYELRFIWPVRVFVSSSVLYYQLQYWRLNIP
jgi:hypothetical protein